LRATFLFSQTVPPLGGDGQKATGRKAVNAVAMDKLALVSNAHHVSMF
jgi:hypothetical protein